MIRTVMLVLALVFSTCTAWAQDVDTDIVGAREALERGDLLGAGTAVDRALSSSTLTPTQLAALYELRALLAYADDRLGALEEALAALATLGAESPPSFPPPLRVRYEEVRAEGAVISLEVELVTELEDGRRRGRLVPRASGDRGRLVQSIAVRAGLADAALGPYTDGDVLDLGEAHRDVSVRYILMGEGLGGTIVARRGSEAEPGIVILRGLPVDETFLHVALVTVAGILVGGAVAFTMAYLATDGFTAGQPSHLGPVSCMGAACAGLRF